MAKKWKTIAVKLEPVMYDEIQEHSSNGEFDSMGAAIRDILAHGLEQVTGRTGIEQRVIRANADSAAKRRLSVLLHGAIKIFDGQHELEGEEDENLDDQYDFEE